MITIVKRYDVDTVLANSGKVFVYGDNLERHGKAGQAIIRDCRNTIGIPTKRKPTMDEDAFFNDRPDEFAAIDEALFKIHKILDNGGHIVLPEDGFGTGLAKMQEKSFGLFTYMNDQLNLIKRGHSCVKM